ncbi:MAG: HD domain-containing phosphohydrolase [Thermodesulfobacteriota bacterium]
MSSKILIADDDGLIRDAVTRILEMFGHEVVAFPGGQGVVDYLDNNRDFSHLAAIILDINMPGMDGFETMKAIRRQTDEVPVLFLTGAGSMEYAVKAINLGAYDFISKPIEDLDLFNVKIQRAIEKRSYVLQEKLYKVTLEKEVLAKTRELAEKNDLLRQYSRNLEISTVSTILSLQAALEAKDEYTAGHTTRVTEYALMIGRAMRLPDEDMTVLERACELHDIGKLVIDVSCIQKPGPLTPEEWLLVKKHPVVGESIIRPLTFLERERTVIRHHHERLDGKGYPDGLSGNDLDLLTRIVIVADSFDAMTSKRSYKVNMGRPAAFHELRACSGTQFDRGVVELFISLLQIADSA